MIALPLTWRHVGGAPSPWYVSEDGKYRARVLCPGQYLAEHLDTERAIGAFASIEAAQAACERHHQATYTCGLTLMVRATLRDAAVAMVAEGDGGRKGMGLRLLETLDAAISLDAAAREVPR